MIKELEYELTKKDIFKFSFFHNEIKNKFSLIFSLIVFITLVIYALFLIIFKFYDLYIYVVSFFVVFFIFLILPATIAIFKNKNISLNIKIDSESSVLVIDNIYGHSEINWSQMHKIYKLKNLLLIYMTKNAAIVIPKRIFATEQEMNETWELIQECYNKYKEEK